MEKNYEMQSRQARAMFAEPCIGRNTRFHGGNCQSCCLRGDGKANTEDERGLAPNYAGWARIYVQDERAIPEQFEMAFKKELERTDNPSYVQALKDDIEHYGVLFASNIPF